MVEFSINLVLQFESVSIPVDLDDAGVEGRDEGFETGLTIPPPFYKRPQLRSCVGYVYGCGRTSCDFELSHRTMTIGPPVP